MSAEYLHEIVDLPYRKCVGIMLINKDRLIFAGQRIDGIAEAWQMPQGGIDEGEDSFTAALRELEEETGITSDLVKYLAESFGIHHYDLPPQLIPQLWGGNYRGQEQKWYLLRFLGSDNQIKINTKHPEFLNWDWMTPKELIESIVDFKHTVYQALFKEFEDFL